MDRRRHAKRLAKSLRVRARLKRSSKVQRARKDRPVHAHVEIGKRPAVIEVQSTEAGMQVEPGGDGVVDRADELPVDMRAETEAADIGISRRAVAVAEIAANSG